MIIQSKVPLILSLLIGLLLSLNFLLVIAAAAWTDCRNYNFLYVFTIQW